MMDRINAGQLIAEDESLSAWGRLSPSIEAAIDRISGKGGTTEDGGWELSIPAIGAVPSINGSSSNDELNNGT